MKLSPSSQSSSRGSSNVLVILAVTSFILMFALMFRSSRQSDGEREAGAQEDAVSSTFGVFNAYEAALEENGDGSESSDGTQSAADLPMHLTDLPKEEGEGNTKKSVPPIPGLEKKPSAFTPPVSPAGDFDSPVEETGELESPAGDWSSPVASVAQMPDLGPEAARDSSGDAMAEGRLPGRKGPELPVVEHVVPNAGVDPSPSGMIFIRGKSGETLPVELAAGLDGAASKRGTVYAPSQAPEVITFKQTKPVNRLSPPLFSLPERNFPTGEFDRKLKLADANVSAGKQPVSRLLYSINDGDWQMYEKGEEITIPPGASVAAYCESVDGDWSDSEKVIREFASDGEKLDSPRISASAVRFDELLNQRVLVSIMNPNEFSTSKVEYRVDGGSWMPYTAPFRLESKAYSKSGANVEARALKMGGGQGGSDSDAVALKIEGMEEGALAADGGEKLPIDPAAMDLGMAVYAHGYSERISSVAEETSMAGAGPAIPVVDYSQPPEVVQATAQEPAHWAAEVNGIAVIGSDLFESAVPASPSPGYLWVTEAR